MADSFDSAAIPLGSDPQLRDRFANRTFCTKELCEPWNLNNSLHLNLKCAQISDDGWRSPDWSNSRGHGHLRRPLGLQACGQSKTGACVVSSKISITFDKLDFDLNVDQGPHLASPLSIVTAMVDSIDFTRPLRYHWDLSGTSNTWSSWLLRRTSRSL